MNQDNISQITITGYTTNSTLLGTNSAISHQGVAIFDDLVFVYEPGADNIQYRITSSALDSSKLSQIGLRDYSLFSVSFRYCMPGEIQRDSSTCNTCAAGTYSLEWNSTSWENWLDNVSWLGGTELSVSDDYWRINENSTTILSWPRPSSWLGGYHPNNIHPVECGEGYGGYLCSECQIVNGTKYQRVSAYICAKCPDPVLNAIRVIIVTLVAFAFLTVFIISVIRKKKENQYSILMRIFTNYLQLIVVALSFNLRLPKSVSDTFTPASIVGSASDTFLSFDCFIEDTEVKSFAPSTELFKVFMTAILPIILLLIYAIIFVASFFTWKEWGKSLKRNIIVSMVWIIFFFHPTLTKSALSVFEWIKVDENLRKMKLNTEYDCYSREHLIWATFIAIPMIMVWVIGCPVIAFIILYKRRYTLEEGRIKIYMLVLYQGLKQKVFYWEFVNTIRKTSILMVNVFLSSTSVNYQVLVSVIILVSIIKIQDKLQPYKFKENSIIEIQGTVAGAITLFWGIIFTENQDEHPGFMTMSLIIMILINIRFIIVWFYMVLQSLNIKNPQIQNIIESYRIIFWIKKIDVSTSEEYIINESGKEAKILVHKIAKQKKKKTKSKKKSRKSKFK